MISSQEIGAAGACFHKPLAECLDTAVNEVFPNVKKTQLKILDAGAGTGPIGIELLKLGYTDIHALDISQEMLNIAKDKGVPYRRFICCPLTEKKIDELETGEFDALISAGTLIKANVRPEALVEMIRIVKTGKPGLHWFILFLFLFEVAGANSLNLAPILLWNPESQPSYKTIPRPRKTYWVAQLPVPRQLSIFRIPQPRIRDSTSKHFPAPESRGFLYIRRSIQWKTQPISVIHNSWKVIYPKDRLRVVPIFPQR